MNEKQTRNVIYVPHQLDDNVMSLNPFFPPRCNCICQIYSFAKKKNKKKIEEKLQLSQLVAHFVKPKWVIHP